MQSALDDPLTAHWVFWLSAAGVVYAHLGYPLLVWLLARMASDPAADAAHDDETLPDVTVLIPVHNEQATIAAKLANTKQLLYRESGLKALFISDGSTDATAAIIDAAQDDRIQLIVLPERSGKAQALNAGLMHTDTAIVVFSDASILLEPNAIRAIVRRFKDAEIGCVTGEDRIPGGAGEGLYGRYETFVRRQESRVHSIVGASGSFYAQRRALCGAFVPNVAPDFLSVLRTVEQGFRAITEPQAIGIMKAVDSPKDEFQRKVRTILRGMTTLGRYLHLMNPINYGVFSVELFSHKLMRWVAPILLVAMLVSSAVLAGTSSFFLLVLVSQLAFYGLATVALRNWAPRALAMPARIALYFSSVNLATLVAWAKYLTGMRQELWAPSSR